MEKFDASTLTVGKLDFTATYLRRDNLRLNRSLSGVEADNSLRLRSANGLF